VADLGPVPLLDATATCDAAAGLLTLAVIHRDRDRGHTATIELGGAVMTGGLQVSEVSGPDVGATNSFERPSVVGVKERRVELPGGKLEHEFPARSLSVLRMRVRLWAPPAT